MYMMKKQGESMAKININQELVIKSRQLASQIAYEVQQMIDQHTTVTVERAILRICGVDGVDEFGVPLPNVIVDHIEERGSLGKGVLFYVGNAMVQTSLSIQDIAKKVAKGQLDLVNQSTATMDEIKNILTPLIIERLSIIKQHRMNRDAFYQQFGYPASPELYVIVATGNIYEDVIQAKAAARQGADIIAIIRSTGQSLLDYVPFGATTEGFGGTYATQENFRIMRQALDEVSQECGRYIKLVNYASGLCMPEIAAMGALERLDVMLNDSLYGILFRDINMKRTFIDQYFSRVIDAYAGIIINTGEDNYLTTADAIEEAHTVVASQFINEQFALLAHLKEELQGLGHAFEIDPSVEDGFLYELASAQLSRQLFPKAPLKYMPPTKFMTGNIFRGHVQNALFNVASVITNQQIHLLGMMTEAIHTPFMSDRALAIENAKYVFRTMQHLSDELSFKEGGIIETRANVVLEKAHELLTRIKEMGLFHALEQGVFAGVKRNMTGGKGLDHVVTIEKEYFNLVQDFMIVELKEVHS
jgi:beta-lysine 5,6-aminomutase alpha subunit